MRFESGPSGPAAASRTSGPASADGVVSRYVRRNRATTAVMLAVLPAWALSQGAPEPWALGLLVPAWVVCAVAQAFLVGWLPLADRWRRPTVWLQAAGAVVAGTVGVTAGPLAFVWLLVPAVTAADLAMEHDVEHRARWAWGSGAVAGALAAGAVAVAGEGPERAMTVFLGAFAMVGLVGYWQSADTLLARRTAAAEEASVELAAARERLRLSEGLHDVLGRALEVVAFRAELASRLVEADPERARGELDLVQSQAREAVTEVRTLVRAARPVDLRDEVGAARSLLESAGVAVEVRGDPGAVPEGLRDPLGRVMREAATNLLRHARAHTCGVVVVTGPRRVVLEVRNDGVRAASSSGGGSGGVEPRAGADAGAVPGGTGLAAVRRAVEQVGGSVTAAQEGEDFVVRAEVPLPR